MKNHVLVGTAVLAFLAASSGLCAVQTWSSVAGTSLKAEFVSQSGGIVSLRTPEGRTITVSIAALTAESQAQIPATAKVVASATATAPSPTAPAPAGAAPSTTAVPKLSASTRPGGITVPTDEEIAAFKTTLREEDGTTYTFNAGLGPKTLTKKEQSSAARLGKIPFRVTSVFSKSKLVGTKTRSSLMDGSAYLVVLNEAGEVVVARRENLLKLCPS